MSRLLLPVLLVAALATATTGCASRRYVRNRTEPLNTKATDLDKRTAENAQQLGALDEKTGREIKRVDEKAATADTHAGEAAQKATEANNRAGEAMQRADSANSLAQNGITKTETLQKYVDNLDNYQMTLNKTVYFGFNKSNLTDDAKQDLDQLAQSLSGSKKYAIEVQGFTDTTGDPNYNYELSDRRAEGVVRYLTEKHQIPVYRVNRIGLGKDAPVQADNRREARKLSRRVEVKVYTVPELPQTAQGTVGGATSAAPQSQSAPEPAAQRPNQ